RPPGDGGHHFTLAAIQPAKAAGEAAADETLLHPRLALRELPVGRETGEFRARPRAAGRAVVGASRAEHEIAAARLRERRCAEELHVVDLGEALLVDGTAHARGKGRQSLEIGEVDL